MGPGFLSWRHGSLWTTTADGNAIRVDPDTGAFSIAVAAGDMWVTSFAGSDVWRFR